MSFEIEFEFESNIFRKAIYVQLEIWQKYRNEINGFGLALMEVFITLFCWPVNCIIVVIFGLGYLFDLFWRGFKYIFRRKEANK
jgi:hypothetical protein